MLSTVCFVNPAYPACSKVTCLDALVPCTCRCSRTAHDKIKSITTVIFTLAIIFAPHNSKRSGAGRYDEQTIVSH